MRLKCDKGDWDGLIERAEVIIELAEDIKQMMEVYGDE